MKPVVKHMRCQYVSSVCLDFYILEAEILLHFIQPSNERICGLPITVNCVPIYCCMPCVPYFVFISNLVYNNDKCIVETIII